MTCKNCNAPLEEQARFCVKCGAPVADAQQSQPSRLEAPEPELRPRKIDNPVRPPKRPVPAQPAGKKQSADKSREEPADAAHLSKLDKDKDDQPAISAATPSLDLIHEQPTIIVPAETQDGHNDALERIDTLSEQPALMVKRGDAVPHEAAPVTPQDVSPFPFEVRSVPHPELVEVERPEKPGKAEVKEVVSLSSPEPAQPLLYYRLNTTTKGSQKLPAVVNRTAYNRGRRRGCAGCVLSGLGTLIVLLIVVGALWIFALRPYAHNIAQSELDNALTSAVNQLPPQATQLPAGSTIPLNENIINNLIVLNLTPSDPVQHPTTSISGQNIRLDFQLYNFPCAVTMVPTLNNGRLVVGKVGIEGIFAAIMSPEEMTGLLNKHLSDAQSRLQRTVTKVQLKDHEVDLTVS